MLNDWVLSIAMAAIFALALGAVALLRRGERKRAALMALAALVIAANVAIWII